MRKLYLSKLRRRGRFWETEWEKGTVLCLLPRGDKEPSPSSCIPRMLGKSEK